MVDEYPYSRCSVCEASGATIGHETGSEGVHIDTCLVAVLSRRIASRICDIRERPVSGSYVCRTRCNALDSDTARLVEYR